MDEECALREKHLLILTHRLALPVPLFIPPLLTPSIWPLFFFFVAIAVLWGITVYHDISQLLGLAIILIGLAIICTVYASFLWKWNHWRPNSITKGAYFIAFICVVTFQIWAVFVHRPFTYLGTSTVFISLNMIATCIALYLSAMENVRTFDEYPSVGRQSFCGFFSSSFSFRGFTLG